MRGRPKGSISLSESQHHQILDAVSLGASPEAASVAAGVALRTFEDWRARYEGRHTSAGPSKKIVGLFEGIAQAQAAARALAESQAFAKFPRLWLARAPRPPAPPAVPPEEENELWALHELLESSPLFVFPRMCSGRCRCPWHSPRSDEQFEVDQATRLDRERKVRRLIRRGAP